ncbi:MAG: hypothetical protein JNL58_14145 [Planctomyces sp.]|nr:hypothetical protein [Planctomyces sp.]
MNDSSESDLQQFERQLRQMVPASHESLTEDTFYRAGWAAAEKHFLADAADRVVPGSLVRKNFWLKTRTFSCGVVSGLMLWAITASFSGGTSHESSAEIRRVVAGPGAETIRSEEGLVVSEGEPKRQNEPAPAVSSTAPASRVSLLSTLVGEVWPWNAVNYPLSVDSESSMQPALSRVERSRWNDMTASNMSSRQASDLTMASGPSQTMLRTSPLVRKSLEEFL